jgi:hypothetical protein
MRVATGRGAVWCLKVGDGKSIELSSWSSGKFRFKCGEAASDFRLKQTSARAEEKLAPGQQPPCLFMITSGFILIYTQRVVPISVPATRSSFGSELGKKNDEYNQAWPPQCETEIKFDHRDLQSGATSFSDARCVKVCLGMVTPR